VIGPETHPYGWGENMGANMSDFGGLGSNADEPIVVWYLAL